METVALVLCWLGVFQSSLLGVYFLTTASGNKSSLFLGTALMLISVRVAKSTLFIFTSHHSELLFNIGFAAHAAVGPALLFYLRSLNGKWKFHQCDLFQFAPAALIILACPLLSLENFWYRGGYGALLYYTIVYCGLCFVELYRSYTHNLMNEGLSRFWIAILAAVVVVFQGAYFSHYILGFTSYSAAPVLYGASLYVVSFGVLKNKAAYLPVIRQKYQNLNVTDEDLKSLHARILDIMETKHPYLDNNFTLLKLSDMTLIPRHMLSLTFSQVFHESFTNVINRYRIVHAGKILRDPQKDYLSIAGIAFESGFNSVSSFNVFFKKHMGMTPSEFKKMIPATFSTRESI